MFIFNGKSYEGFIKVKEKRYFIEAFLPNYPSLNGSNIKIDWRLKLLFSDSLESHCKNFNNIHELVKSFQKCVEEKLGKSEEPKLWLENPLKTHGFYKRLEEEINQVGEYIKSIDVEKGLLEIEVTDGFARLHKATLKINYNYPKEPIEVISHDLPIQEGNQMQKSVDLKETTTVTGFCRKFNQCIEAFQGFWNDIALVDSRCWVLDPENPTFKDTTRRIKISDSLSVVLTFNPLVPRQRPDVKFLGSRSSVNDIQEVLQKNLEEEIWDEDMDIVYNLNNLLDVDLPSKPDFDQEEQVDLINPGECAICFTSRLDNKIPTLICNNTNCMSEYHEECMFKYLRAIPSNKNYFGRIQGECPNCDQVIYCPVPDFM